MTNMNLIHETKGSDIMLNLLDYSFLRGRIRTYFGSEANFVKELQKRNVEMSAGSFSNKINCKSPFNQIEMIEICNLLGIPIEELTKYFFTKKYEFNS